MKKLTIDDLKNHLPEFQEGLDCKGAIQILKEFVVPAALCQKMSIKSETKLLFVYMGIDRDYSDIHHYLAWLENEGGMLIDLSIDPGHEYLQNKEIVLTDEGLIGYGIASSLPAILQITWKNGRPQAEAIRTGEIMELTDIPLKAPIENVFKTFNDVSFNIRYLLFGNPNFILSMPEDMEACLSYMSPEGNNEACLDDSFCINMKTEGSELRELIIEAGDATPKEFEKILMNFEE